MEDSQPKQNISYWQGSIEAQLYAQGDMLKTLRETTDFLVKENASLWVKNKHLETLQEKFVHEYINIKEMQNREQQKYEDSIKVRLETMNEFREQITQERMMYVTRDILDAQLALIKIQIEPLKTQQDYKRGRDMTLWLVITFCLSLSALLLPFILRVVYK